MSMQFSTIEPKHPKIISIVTQKTEPKRKKTKK